MRVLLDEHLDWRLARAFGDAHEVRSVREMGWAGRRNGDRLEAAEREFEVLVTMARNMEHQQRLPRYDLAVVLLVGTTNRLEDTEGFVPLVEGLLAEGVEAGRLYRVAR
jgi:predicted nuclease of predicted toxin-antitoxin system